MSSQNDPFELLYILEGKICFSDHSDRWYSFMMACCQLISNKLPEIAHHWLHVAQDYRKGLVSINDLVAARVEAWRFLEPNSNNFSLPEVNAIRAVICLMFPESEQDDWFATLDVFLDFTNAVEEHEAEQSAILRELFKDVLAS